VVGPEEPELARQLSPLLGERGAVMISGGYLRRSGAGSEQSLWLRIFPSAKTVTAELAARASRATACLPPRSSTSTTVTARRSHRSSAIAFEAGGTIKDSLPLPNDLSRPIRFPNGRPDAVVLVAYPRAGALAVSQLAAGGFDGRWYFGPSLDTEEFVLNTPAGCSTEWSGSLRL
jgi:hypothetical protein